MPTTAPGKAAIDGRVVPVIDIGRFGQSTHGDAGIDPALIEQMYEVTGRLFALPMADEVRWSSPTGNTYRGWSVREARTAGSGHQPAREMLEVGRYDGAGDLAAAGYGDEWITTYDANIWPDEPAELRAVWRACYDALAHLGDRLLDIMALALGLPAGWFVDKFDRHSSYLCGNLYPAQPQAPAEGELRLGAHTDIGSLTLLHQDDSPGGLQVRDRQGRWCDVEAVPGSFVVNLGDMLAKWTNDRWVATEHRVVNPPRDAAATARMSIPYFQHPTSMPPSPASPPAPVPTKYETVLGGNWVPGDRRRHPRRRPAPRSGP